APPRPPAISGGPPAVVVGTSMDTLSVSISNRLSPGLPASPMALNQVVILPSATVSPSCGIRISIGAYPSGVTAGKCPGPALPASTCRRQRSIFLRGTQGCAGPVGWARHGHVKRTAFHLPRRDSLPREGGRGSGDAEQRQFFTASKQSLFTSSPTHTAFRETPSCLRGRPRGRCRSASCPRTARPDRKRGRG